MLQPLNNYVVVEVYLNLDDIDKPKCINATIVKLPEYIDCILHVGEKVKINLEKALLLYDINIWIHHYAVDIYDIIGVYRDENKEETQQEDNNMLLKTIIDDIESIKSTVDDIYTKQLKESISDKILHDTLIKEIGSIKGVVDNVYTQLNRMKELGIDSVSDRIKELEKDYILINKVEIEPFLFVNRDLFPILQEAPEHVYEVFGKDVSIYLELSHDPEIEDDKLVVTIKCPCSLEESLKLEEKFNLWARNYYEKLDKLLFMIE